MRRKLAAQEGRGCTVPEAKGFSPAGVGAFGAVTQWVVFRYAGWPVAGLSTGQGPRGWVQWARAWVTLPTVADCYSGTVGV